MSLPLSVREIPLCDLAASLGERITKIHQRPGVSSLETCGMYRGKLETLRAIRADLEARYQAREIRRKGLQ